DREAVTRLNGLGDMLRGRLSEQLTRLALPAQVTGKSSLFRLHLKSTPITDYRTGLPSPAPKLAITKVHLAALRRGHLLAPNCSGALATPMTEGDIQDLADAIAESALEVHSKSPWT